MHTYIDTCIHTYMPSSPGSISTDYALQEWGACEGGHRKRRATRGHGRCARRCRGRASTRVPAPEAARATPAACVGCIGQLAAESSRAAQLKRIRVSVEYQMRTSAVKLVVRRVVVLCGTHLLYG